MIASWREHQTCLFRLFADCIPVRGARRSAIYDLSRHEITLFPTIYFDLLELLHGIRLLDAIEHPPESYTQNDVVGMLQFLDENEMLMLVNDPVAFPQIESSWRYPGQIQNAVIDVADTFHDFSKIFDELSSLGCQHVQVRGFSNLFTIREAGAVIQTAYNTTIVGVELILTYEKDVTVDMYLAFVRSHPLLTSLTVHSAPETKIYQVDIASAVSYEGAPCRELRFSASVVSSETCCGIITQKHLTPPSIETFFEAKHFNGCLNRKIAIDKKGDIRQCPSMRRTYGSIRDNSLLEAVSTLGYQDVGNLQKDRIAICRDCEFRYACSDCRAYTESPADVTSKPLKCGYDPYTSTWSDWTSDESKVAVARLYGIAPMKEVKAPSMMLGS